MTGARSVTYVEEVAPPSVLAVNWLAREVPLHATSTGLTLPAWLPEDESRSLVREPRRYTDSTLTDADQLVRTLRETRKSGYAACAGELEPTLYGVSAPVLAARREHPVAVSIWGPVDRVPRSRFPGARQDSRRGGDRDRYRDCGTSL